ncbi:hypothetical protein OAK75_12955 [Bacteriovoracales bacterium]|nr:hypothetical protein [Bacteriovoracales bacterium]
MCRLIFEKERKRLAVHYGRQKNHPYYIRMKLNLLSREEKKVIEKLGQSFDKKILQLEKRLESVTNWSKMVRKVNFKKNLLEFLYKLPL